MCVLCVCVRMTEFPTEAKLILLTIPEIIDQLKDILYS